MIKIAHFGDVHWRSLTRHREYRRSFEDAFVKLRELEPDIILIAGDIVHSKTQGISPELINHLVWWFKEMAKIADVHVTLGNHDGLVLNPDREDAISPIINAISPSSESLHSINLYKDSGVYSIPVNGSSSKYNLCVFSCFDEDGWNNVVPEKEKINIATFHGPVHGSKTDENWSLESSTNIDFFKNFEYSLLGDIHKHQFLTDRIAYCGSTIQQNYGESPEKGFLFWQIDEEKFDVNHIKVFHDSPFVTLDYDGDLDSLQTEAENFPEKSRFRIRVVDTVTQGERSQIRAAIKGVADPREIVFKTEENKASQEVSDSAIEDNQALDSFDSVWSLVKDYYETTDLGDRTLDLMRKILADAWNKAKIPDDIASGRWSVRRLEFENVFGYGEGNIVNFDSTSGITGIFGKNRSGKSSICGALTYALFNGTDRGPMKSMHVVNARKNHCRVKAVISKKGNNILIDRQTVKKTNRKGQVNASTYLNLFECDETGTPIKDLSDEQRRETEKTLRNKIGSLDDFLMTSLASQGDINRFVRQGSAERKTILAKFLRLDILDQLLGVLKIEVAAARYALSKIPEMEFDAQLYDKKTKIEARKKEREEEIEALEKISGILNSLSATLENQTGDEEYSPVEIEGQETKVQSLEHEIADIESKLSSKKAQKEIHTELLGDLEAELEKFDYNELRETKSHIAETERTLLITKGEIDSKSIQLKSDKRSVKKLTDVPCGDSFPTCKYIMSAKKAKNSLIKKQEDLDEARKYTRVLKSEMKKLLLRNVDQKLREKSDHDKKISHLRQLIAECDINSVRFESRLRNLCEEASRESLFLDKMKINQCDEETARQRELLLKKREIAQEKRSEAKSKIQMLSERIGLLTAEVEQLRRDKSSYEENNLQYTVLSLLSKSLSRDGIPLQIVKKKLPIINREISNILTGVTGFTVELESDNKGMDIILDYGDSRRIIECCSGMEKMMASLAIRTALIRVSSLPKSDMLIIDEGFGALDSSNIESCTSLLRGLTKTFKTILIISHVDTVKDVVDNVIEISSRKGLDSKVTFL
jgi:DNA repair exonuclease SbcCD ATPase subunit/DNA repair exonuclease SbcCD nuclease subunit